MPNFIYKIKDETGEVHSGISAAEDVRSLRKTLRDQGWYAVGIRRLKEKQAFSLFKRKINLDTLIMSTHQLTSMLDTGIPILRALDILWKQSDNSRFQIVISQIKNRLSEGASLSTAFDEFPDVFPPIYRALLGVAEKGASLVKILQKLLEYLNQQKEFVLKLKKAVTYPVIVVCVALLVVIVMLLWVIPTFQLFFSRMKIELPLFTKIVINISSTMRIPSFWIFTAILLIAIFIFYKKFSATGIGRDCIDRLKLRIPFFGKLYYTAIIARLLRSLGLLIGGGLPIVDSIKVAGEVAINTQIIKALGWVKKRISEGVSLGVALAETKMFPSFLVEMVSVGEESGELVEMLDKTAVHFEEELDFRLNRFLTALEPALVIFVGGIVIFILLSIYLPIFKLWGALSGLG